MSELTYGKAAVKQDQQSAPKSTLYNVKTREAETLPFDKIGSAILDGTHSYLANEKVNVLGPDGGSYNVDGKDLHGVLSQGYQLESPRQQAVRQYLKENEGIGGTAKVALGQFADEALFGIPETIFDHTQDEFAVAKKEALKKEHGIANALGGIAGFGASMFVGGPLFKGAGIAGAATEKAILGATGEALAARLSAAGVERGATAMGANLARRTLAAGARMGVEGAVVAAPKAITETMLGDPEQAAETLLMGVGAGAVIGGVGAAGGALARKFSGLSSKALTYGSEKAGALAESMSTPEGLARAKEIAKSGVEGAAGLAGAAMGGWPGGFVGKMVGEGTSGLVADHLATTGALKDGILFAEQAMKKVAHQFDRIPVIMNALAEKGFRPTELGSDAFSQFSKMTKEDKTKQFESLSRDITQLATNPALLTGNVGEISGVVSRTGAPEIASQYTQKQINAVNYLYNNLPKNGKEPTPFKKDTWKAPVKEMDAFIRKLEVVNDPFVVLNKLHEGTLHRDHVDALNGVFPKLGAQIADRIRAYGFDPKSKPLSLGPTNKTSLLTQMDLSGGTNTTQTMGKLQNNFMQQDPPGNNRKNLRKLPSLSTGVGTLSNK